MYLCHSEEDHIEPDEEDEDEGDGEEEASLLQEEDEAESMELDQAPAAIPVPAPDEPPVKRKRGRPPKNAPKPPTPSKSARVAAKTTASGENTDRIRQEMNPVDDKEHFYGRRGVFSLGVGWSFTYCKSTRTIDSFFF